jgi:hypothetical protein
MHDRQGVMLKRGDPVLFCVDTDRPKLGVIHSIRKYTLTVHSYKRKRLWAGSPDRVEKLSDSAAMLWKLENE